MTKQQQSIILYAIWLIGACVLLGGIVHVQGQHWYTWLYAVHVVIGACELVRKILNAYKAEAEQ